ncbi:MAG: DNA-binding response regulator [Rhodomicrobium sp.]|nr:MAG: DNA-binding response regulator [Rhodomicrobium sp.]
MKILVMEHGTYCNPRISSLLDHTRNAVDSVDSIEDLEDHISVGQYDYVTLDLSSLEFNAEDAVSTCNRRVKQTPILVVLSPANRNIISKLLDLGADDFILRPFEDEDFYARVTSLLKRTKVINYKVQEFGALRFDVVTGMVSVNNKYLELTKREHGVLEILFRSKGNMVSKDQIAEKLFSTDDDADTSSIRIYVSRLRQKIKGSGMSIRSIRGMGYSLDLEN